MEKVKLTQAQANAIDELRNRKAWDDEKIIGVHANAPNNWYRLSALNGLPLLTLVDALRIGYEFEPEYKVGDWVARLDGNTFYPKGAVRAVEILSVEEGHCGSERVMHGENMEWGTPVTHIRHATPEEIKVEQERRTWAKIGREPGEFRKGDIVIDSTGKTYRLITGVELYPEPCDLLIPLVMNWYDHNAIEGFWPAESFISLGGGE